MVAKEQVQAAFLLHPRWRCSGYIDWVCEGPTGRARAHGERHPRQGPATAVTGSSSANGGPAGRPGKPTCVHIPSVPRTQISREVTAYIRSYQLVDPLFKYRMMLPVLFSVASVFNLAFVFLCIRNLDHLHTRPQ
jgi:hypothetical protein